MRFTFRTKVITGIAFIEIVMFSMLIVNDLRIMRASHHEVIRNTIDTTLTTFKTSIVNAVISLDSATLDELTKRLAQTPSVKYVSIKDMDNKIISSSGEAWWQKHKRIQAQKTLADAKDGIFYTEYPLDTEIGRLATIHAGFDVSGLQTAEQQARDRALRIALAGLVISGVFSYVLGTVLSRRLKLLRQGAKKIARGNYSVKLPVTGQDEMAQVSRSFNKMARELRHAKRETQAFQQELVNLNQSLEHKVKQRTAELSKINTKLQNTNVQLKEAHTQLLQSEKMASIGQLAAGVAHEINNPVGFVNSNLGSLEKYLQNLLEVLDVYSKAEPMLEQHTEMLEQILEIKQRVELEYIREDSMELMQESKEGLLRVKQIVQDLKDFSHIDQAEWQWFDLHGGLDTTLNIVNNELKYKAEVVKEYGELPDIHCLPSQLNQVFMNLFVNAAHAIIDKGQITIRTHQENKDWVWVDVSDNGRGIEPEHLKRIFEPFFTTKEIGKGTGLGLALSYGIINKHGGTIKVISEPGKGTTFRVWLPVNQTKQDSEENSGPEQMEKQANA